MVDSDRTAPGPRTTTSIVDSGISHLDGRVLDLHPGLGIDGWQVDDDPSMSMASIDGSTREEQVSEDGSTNLMSIIRSRLASLGSPS